MKNILKKVTLFIIILTISVSIINAKTIAKIPEASGICFIPNTKELIVVNDEGWIYRLKTDGKIIQKKYLGNYDLEGVALDEATRRLLIADESTNSILLVSMDEFNIIKAIKRQKF